MSQMNGYTIQQALKQRSYVSVPWLQVEYDLQYAEARELLRRMTARGWLRKEAEGNQYQVVAENLKLRNINKPEVDAICTALTAGCIGVLKYIQKKPDGATMAELVAALKDEDDARQAVTVLLEKNLIYCVDGVYFNCIPAKAVQVLQRVWDTKRRSMMRRRMSDEAQEPLDFGELFDELFGDDEE